MNELSVVVDVSRPNYPRARIVVDGLESLDEDHTADHDPDDLLATGALLPRATPHRVALHGCCCGDFGCSTLTALIGRVADLVTWYDVQVVGGAAFDRALPYGDAADPLAPARGRRPPPDPADAAYAFEASTYLRTVRDAMSDRSWESRPRTIARLLREQLRPTGRELRVVPVGPDGDEEVAVNFRAEGTWHTWAVPIPAGDAARGAARLGADLARLDPRQLSGARELRW